MNRGIDADTTGGVLERIGDITHMKPAKIFIMIGGNDFVIGKSVAGILDNYRKIIAQYTDRIPGHGHICSERTAHGVPDRSHTALLDQGPE